MSGRIVLVPMTPAFLEAALADRRDESAHALGCAIPALFPTESERRFLALRWRQMREDARCETWCPHAIVLGREMLRLEWVAGRTHREVARSLGVSVGAVALTLSRALSAGLHWPAAEKLSEARQRSRSDCTGRSGDSERRAAAARLCVPSRRAQTAGRNPRAASPASSAEADAPISTKRGASGRSHIPPLSSRARSGVSSTLPRPIGGENLIPM